MNKIKHIKHCTCQCEENQGRDLEAVALLQSTYNDLDGAVNSTSELEYHFASKNDKRSKKANKAIDHIIKAQELLNSMAEDEDIAL